MKEMIIDMTLIGSGIRDIARVLKISTTMVIKAIKKSMSTATGQSKHSGTYAIQKSKGMIKMDKSR